MYIVKPNVECYFKHSFIQHIARVASVCYGTKGKRNSDLIKDRKLVENLLNAHHNSVFRHYAMYYIVKYEDYIKNDDLFEKIIELLHDNFVDIRFDEKTKDYLIAVNYNYIIDHEDFKNIFSDYEVQAVELCKYKEGSFMIHYTFGITTQISTSREFNRVSPNAITEESTRYCNYLNGRYSTDVTVCQPFWMDAFYEFEKINDSGKPIEKLKYNGKNITAIIGDKKIVKPITDYTIKTNIDSKGDKEAKVFLGFLHKACYHYNNLISHNFIPQEAREVLPLSTATYVVYTYSVDEWIKILLLRYYGVTGAPHPNAYIIAKMIKEELEHCGHDINNRAKELYLEIYKKNLVIN